MTRNLKKNDDDWGQTWSHLKDGHRNGQEVIRALDTKTNILGGLSIFAMTTTVGLLKMTYDLLTPRLSQLNQAIEVECFFLSSMFILIAGFMLAGMLLGIACIISCLNTLTARGREKGSLPATILFPHLSPKDTGKSSDSDNAFEATAKYYKRIIDGNLSKADILAEYHDQMVNVGTILGEKVSCNKRAAKWFKYQVCTIPVIVLLIVITSVYLFSASNDEGAKQAAQNGVSIRGGEEFLYERE